MALVQTLSHLYIIVEGTFLFFAYSFQYFYYICICSILRVIAIKNKESIISFYIKESKKDLTKVSICF
jgi:hypothetical protein